MREGDDEDAGEGGGDAERLDAELVEGAAVDRGRRSPTPLSSASRGEVNSPHESVPQMPARPCADSAPTGSSSILSIAMHAEDDDDAGDRRR